MRLFQNLSKPFVVFVERFYPDPFVFAIILTLATFGLTLSLTNMTSTESVNSWGQSLSGLLTFTTQIVLTLITAHALAHTDTVQNLLANLGKLPNTPFQAYFFVALLAGLGSLLAWSLGLIVGAIIAQQVALQAQQKNLKLHYPLLVACAYSGFVIWHMGYSSSAALFVATEGHSLQDKTGLIPVSETIFASWNILIAFITLIIVSTVCALMRPPHNEIIELSTANKQTVEANIKSIKMEPVIKNTPASRLENSRLVSLALAVLFIFFLISWFFNRGLELNLNIVNWSFLGIGLLLSRSPIHYIGLITNAAKTIGPIIIQYPFYAGIMGLMTTSGLVIVISDWFTAISTAETLSFWAFVAGGIVNFFIPSGGGQWAIQGPIFIEAANNLGVDHSRIVMGVAYGDQWSNMIQPFWTIPMLAIAGLNMRQIMGYTFVIFIITFFTFGGGLYLAGPG